MVIVDLSVLFRVFKHLVKGTLESLSIVSEYRTRRSRDLRSKKQYKEMLGLGRTIEHRFCLQVFELYVGSKDLGVIAA
jgi:hypothetical protein